ncbi:MAG: hypothetical protein ACFFGZ_20260 [Candidatus Thorarchaeota archaeon]
MEKGEGKPRISLVIIRMVLLWIFIPSLIVIALVLIVSAIIFGFEEDGLFATSSLMFFVGAAIAGVGALVGGGASETRLVGRGTYDPHSASQIMVADDMLRYRGQQISFGLICSCIGIIVIIFAIAVFYGLVPFFP